MHHLAHQPDVRLERRATCGQRALKIEIERVGGVESQPVNLKPIDPRCDRAEKVIANGRIAEVQFHQVVVAGPSLVVKRLAVRAAAAEVEVIPVAIGRRAPLLANVAKGPEVATCTIEDGVEHEANSAAMKFLAYRREHRVVAEPPINAEVVP